MKSKKGLNLLFSLTIVILFATPIILILYSQFLGVDIRKLITMDVQFNVTFIISFITPFIGLYILKLKENVDTDEQIKLVITHLVIIAMSLFIMGNLTIAILISILVIYMKYQWELSFKELFDDLKIHSFKMNDWLVPITILFIAIAIRFMLILVSNS